MKFEEFLTEAKGALFAWKPEGGKWREDVRLPFANAKAISVAVNGERADVSSIVTLFNSHYQAPHARPDDKVEIIDMSAKLSSTSETVDIEVKYNYFRDRSKVLKAKLKIQDSE